MSFILRVAEHFERTDTGRQRKGNEDAYFARSPLFVVADGMGGAQAGEVASGTAVEVFGHGLPEGDAPVESRLRALVQEANSRINALAQSDDSLAGMGTTVTAAYVGEDELAIAHVGDSRMYRLREGHFERLTDDHTLVEELVRQGKLTPEEADHHPQRSIITRALGPEPGVEPDSFTWPGRDGDVYLICSDGLTGMVPEQRVGEMLASAGSLPEAGRALVDAANAAGGRDNITVVLFRLEQVETGTDAGDHETSEHALAPATAAAAAAPAVAAAAPEAPARTEPVARRQPRAPRSPAPARRRRRPRLPAGLVAAVVVLVVMGLGAYYATQTVYFVGASADGFVTVYRGVPYDLPAGLHLYGVNYVSSVPVDTLSTARRRIITEHKLRAKDDAQDLVRQMETGELASR
ncbi:MAG: Stp1/IreP family PP2C-type Ser/Thr phosphatase [Solirubrobacteraceae bacterium]